MFSKADPLRKGTSGAWKEEEVCLKAGKPRGMLRLSWSWAILVTAELESFHSMTFQKIKFGGKWVYFNYIQEGLATE